MNNESLQDGFTSSIMNQIISGELEFGSKLPSERTLASTFHVSRSVINRGLVKLAQDGFITLTPRVGATVNNFVSEGNINTLIALMKYDGNKLGESEITSILVLKGALDILTIQLIEDRFSNNDYEHLSNILIQFEKHCGCINNSACQKNCDPCTEYLFNFFHYLSTISGNLIIPLIYTSFKLPITTLWSRFLQLHSAKPLLESARSILENLNANNSQGAIDTIQASIHKATQGSNKVSF